MTDRHDTTDDLDPLEQQLRAHLTRRATTIDDAAVESDTLVALRREAVDQTAHVRRRRVGAASIGSVAAAAVVVGLVLHAQSPQPVSSTDDPADAPAVAGVATGSSTGSTTGGAKGWTGTYADTVDATDTTFPTLRPTLAATTDERLTSLSWNSTRQGSGAPAPDLAVLAHLESGSALQFVTASVQRTDQLGPGKGTDTVIGGRPAQIIAGNNGWLRIVWTMDEEHRVLLQSYGVDLAELDRLATTLHTDAAGTWTMDPGDSGLAVVEAPAPTEQRSLHLSWATPDPLAQGTDLKTDRSSDTTDSTDLGLTTGGAYEFWASLAGSSPWRGGNPTVLDVDLGDGNVAPGVLLEQGTYEDGSNQASLDVLDPSGVVVSLSFFNTVSSAPGATTLAPTSAATTLRDAAPALFTRLDPTEWAGLLARATEASAAQRARDEGILAQKMAADGLTSSTTIDERGSAGAPPASVAPSSTSAPSDPANGG